MNIGLQIWIFFPLNVKLCEKCFSRDVHNRKRSLFKKIYKRLQSPTFKKIISYSSEHVFWFQGYLFYSTAKRELGITKCPSKSHFLSLSCFLLRKSKFSQKKSDYIQNFCQWIKFQTHRRHSKTAMRNVSNCLRSFAV